MLGRLFYHWPAGDARGWNLPLLDEAGGGERRETSALQEPEPVERLHGVEVVGVDHKKALAAHEPFGGGYGVRGPGRLRLHRERNVQPRRPPPHTLFPPPPSPPSRRAVLPHRVVLRADDEA